MIEQIQFLPINLDKDWSVCLQFRIDSYVASFGSADNFERDGGATHYKEWLEQKMKSNPYSAVHIHFDGKIIGQMELGKIKNEPDVGLVNLYYLAPEYRGRNLSRYLDKYAEKFMKEQGHKVARLNVSPTNQRAIRFYQKNGWQDIGPNLKHPEVHTMEKSINFDQILELQRPSENLYPKFMEFVEDMRANNQTLWDPYLPKQNEAVSDFVGRLLIRESNPEAPLVPETIYWAVHDGNVVGRISLRHRLEGNLHKIGGHIGYEVSPKWRRKGFATEMLRQILLTGKAREIGNLLLTCSPNNEASNKTIISNGGNLTQTIFVESVGEDRNHYWISLENK